MERDIQATHIADPVACASMTYTSGAALGGIVTDLLACKTAIDANNTAIDAALVAIENIGVVAKT